MKILQNKWYIFLLLAIIIFLIYANSLNNDFISDDITYLVRNPKINSFEFVTDTPLTITKAFINWITYKLFGLSPLAFRLVNIIFHILNSWLLFALTGILLNPAIAVLAVFIFAVHPIIVESVTWIGAGGYPMFFMFFLLSLLFYIRSPKKISFYIISIFLFIIMLATSEKSTPLFLCFITYEVTYGKISKNWHRIAPFVILSIFWLGMIFGPLKYAQNRITALNTNFYQEAGLDNPLLKIPIASTKYLELIVWPDKLSFYHSDFTFSRQLFFINISFGYILILLLIIFWIFNKRIFFFYSIFFITLIPSFSPLKISWWVAERYVYLGSYGIILTLSYIYYSIYKKNLLFKNRYIYYIFPAILILALSTRTIIRNNDWKNQDALWFATSRTAPMDPKNHNNLGDTYGRQGNLDMAEAEFKKAIELNPKYADAYNNLANVYLQKKQFDEALSYYQQAINLNPNIWQSKVNTAFIYSEKGLFEKAILYLNEALKIYPDNPDLYFSLGQMYNKLGRIDNAKESYQNALKIKPDYQEVINELNKIK